MVSSGQAAPPFVRMAAHPLRWRLLTELAGSDHRVRELTERLGQPQNLVSYHLRLLRDGGLVTARRSSFDGRDSYYHLDLDRCAGALTATGADLHPVLRLRPPAPPALPAGGRVRVLFACTGNSSRSPIAEALLRHRAGDHVDVTSAGSRPKPRIHPDAIRVLREDFGIELDDRRPRHLDTLTGHRFDYVITVCDKVREVCPDFGDDPRPVHWSIPDPAAAEDTHPAFADVARELDTRIGHLLAVFAATAPREVQP
ncbi:ArsR family transcriptional regulator [Amycolatopsis sp. NBRC 101858]|uniref:arsenate reductase/protein-tyrosine-phosphatase family protein n=1 Tax=Amycolatopsis sp. NBRC 101858 TaxID=3032200 RepID=UPI0024A1F25D|nr:ArsR family transcriptional regulator [Amycolatopsis sp. NBRC 101858]GLY37544.1 ArsR family transcriptional regulator [Amycolatopsis sp. NBRC 101858]